MMPKTCLSSLTIRGFRMLFAVMAVCSWGAAGPAEGAAFDHGHAALTRVLQQHVRGGLVDYAALKKAPAPLEAYLDALAGVTRPEFDGWTKPQQVAFLINLYNAATLKMILDHYPLESIKDIGWFLKGPWDQEVVQAWGRTLTLAQVEHKILRREYDEPRIHFALVCAARGCPPLRTEAYQAERLEEQLEDQGRIFLRNPPQNRVDPRTKTLHLSPIFDWFEKDFTQRSGTVQKFVAPYLEEEDQKALETGRYRIRHTDYDWTLNDLSPR